jgi:transcription initiation factor TFIIB
LCPDCKIDPPNLVEEFASGDVVCGDCGLVVGDKIIDTRSECEWCRGGVDVKGEKWRLIEEPFVFTTAGRTFANEEGDDPSRVGSANNPLMDGLTEQLDTRIGNRDGGTGVARDLQRAMGRGAGTSNRIILDAFQDIQSKCDIIHLPRTVSETAKTMFKQVEQDQILRGKKSDAIIAAAIYCACKTNKVPRTFREICQLTNVSQKLIGKCFKEMQSAYGLNQVEAGSDSVAATNAVDLIGRYCNHLGLEMAVVRCTEEIATIIRDRGILAGRSPITVAAASIYMTTRLMGADQNAKMISRAAGVSDVTIKNSYKNLLEFKSELLTVSLLCCAWGV